MRRLSLSRSRTEMKWRMDRDSNPSGCYTAILSRDARLASLASIRVSGHFCPDKCPDSEEWLIWSLIFLLTRPRPCKTGHVVRGAYDPRMMNRKRATGGCHRIRHALFPVNAVGNRQRSNNHPTALRMNGGLYRSRTDVYTGLQPVPCPLGQESPWYRGRFQRLRTSFSLLTPASPAAVTILRHRR